MTKAANGFTHEGLTEQQAHPDSGEEFVRGLPMRTPEEVAAKLAGITGTLSFLASGCEDDSGPQLWEALRFLSDELCDVSEVVGAFLQARGSQR
jgi:hypothetical protein